MPASSLLRRLTASALVGALVSLSAGLAPYEALAAEMRSGAADAAVSLPAAAAPALPATALGAPGFSATPAAGLEPGLPAAPAAGPEAAAASEQRAAAEVSAASRGVEERMQALGDVSAAPAGAAHETGEAVQVLISGRRAPVYGDAVAVPSRAAMASAAGITLSAASGEQYHAQPAGQDSIGAPAQQLFGNGPWRNATPPTPPGGPQGPDEQQPQQPFLGRLASAIVALLPGALLGWPLVTAGFAVTGGLLIAASLGLAALPFFSERTPAFVRGLPGTALGALGVATAAVGLSVAGAWPIATMGAIVALGGWGFRRFALDQDKRRSSGDVLATLLGGLGAATGAGLVLLSPAGWPFLALTVASGAVSLILLMHLPGFVGAGIRAAFESFYLSAQDGFHAATSISRDTAQRKRLEAWTLAYVDQSNWNALWLGLLVWLPIGLVELAKSAVGVVAGLVQGAFRALPMMAWGAAYELAPKSAATRFFARWSIAAFSIQKAGPFNALEKKMLGWANSDSFFKRLGAAVGISVWQVAWLISSTVAAPFAALFGWIQSLRDPLPGGDAPSPRSFHLDHDALSQPLPGMPKPAVSRVGVVAARALAVAIGALPLYFLGLPLWGAGFEGMAAVIAMAGVAVMPAMPESGRMPDALRRLPGWMMTATGAVTTWYGAWSIAAGLPTGWIVPLAVLALLGGFGFTQLITNLRDEKTEKYKVDDGEYIGGFGAALALMAALGAAMLGLTGIVPTGLGVVAVLLSPLLLLHLGRPFWSGVWAALTAWLSPTEDVHRVLSFWNAYRPEKEPVSFGVNLRAWYRYWLDKSVWNGPIVLVPFLLDLAVRIVDGVVSLAAGLVVWPFRAIPAFMLARSQARSYNSPQSRFWRAFQKHLVEGAEGSKATSFDPYAAKLLPAMAEKSEKTSRPTLKAVGAFILSWLVQAAWLVRLAVWLALTPLWLIGAYFAGVDARAQEPKP